MRSGDGDKQSELVGVAGDAGGKKLPLRCQRYRKNMSSLPALTYGHSQITTALREISCLAFEMPGSSPTLLHYL